MQSSETLLDNPIWNALATRQSRFGRGDSHARRFDSAIGPLSGLREQSEEAYAELRELLGAGEIAILFLEEKPNLPLEWKLLRSGALTQMICPGDPIPPSQTGKEGEDFRMAPLTPDDVPQMLDLVRLTEPGPFGERTIELGGYLGIWQGARLAAMTGQRLAPPGFTEISAVCTHPDFRGRSYAQLLVARVAQRIRERGETPFLTLLASNTQAQRVYEAAGFVTRRTLELAVIAPEAQHS